MSNPVQTRTPADGGCPGDLLVRATEAAAIAAASVCGQGDEQSADRAAATAMHRALMGIELQGRIMVGERHTDEVGLAVGAVTGLDTGPEMDFALDALEGSTLAAKAMPNALSLIAAARRGGFLPVPDIYMDKLAIGPGYPADLLDLDAPAGETALRLAAARGVHVSRMTACVLDRPRHDRIIADLRRVGARVCLISDGDVAGVINTSIPDMEIDFYIGQGGAPEGVLAAAALSCLGGQFQARLAPRNDAERRLAEEAGLSDIRRRYSLGEIVSGDCVFAATGVTRGGLLDGVSRAGGRINTHSLVMSSRDGVVRRVRCDRPDSDHFKGAHV